MRQKWRVLWGPFRALSRTNAARTDASRTDAPGDGPVSARAAARRALELTTCFDRVVLASLREGRIVDVVRRNEGAEPRVPS